MKVDIESLTKNNQTNVKSILNLLESLDASSSKTTKE